MKKTIVCLIFWVLCGYVYAVTYTPASVPNPKNAYADNWVCNPDGIIGSDEEAYMNALAVRLKDTAGVELCVVALESIGEEDAFEFQYELFQRWGIGSRERSTGVMIFLVVESRDIRIMTGGGIEGVLTDGDCSRIIREDIAPLLKSGDYGAGLAHGALRIYEQCTKGEAPEELRHASVIVDRGQYAQDEDEMTVPEMLLCLGVMLIILVVCIRLAVYQRCPKCGKRRMKEIKRDVIQAATLTAEGVGIATYKCSRCGHTHTKTYVIAKEVPVVIVGGGGFGGGHGGGGFSGGSWGGGGTFGGGAGGKF